MDDFDISFDGEVPEPIFSESLVTPADLVRWKAFYTAGYSGYDAFYRYASNSAVPLQFSTALSVTVQQKGLPVVQEQYDPHLQNHPIVIASSLFLGLSLTEDSAQYAIDYAFAISSSKQLANFEEGTRDLRLKLKIESHIAQNDRNLQAMSQDSENYKISRRTLQDRAIAAYGQLVLRERVLAYDRSFIISETRERVETYFSNQDMHALMILLCVPRGV